MADTGALKSLRAARRAAEMTGPDGGEPLTDETGAVVAYQFGLPGGGAVVVAADDAMAPVFFYSPDSRFDPTVPLASVMWQDYCRQVRESSGRADAANAARYSWSALEQAAVADAGTASALSVNPVPAVGLSAITRGPLVRSRWNQFEPYNRYSPARIDCRLPKPSCRCPTGCVATSMAQILRYWQSPIYGTGAPPGGECYVWDNGSADRSQWPSLCFGRTWFDGQYQPVCSDADAPFYDWRNMPELATTQDPPEAQERWPSCHTTAASRVHDLLHGGPAGVWVKRGCEQAGSVFRVCPGGYRVSRGDYSDDRWFGS